MNITGNCRQLTAHPLSPCNTTTGLTSGKEGSNECAKVESWCRTPAADFGSKFSSPCCPTANPLLSDTRTDRAPGTVFRLKFHFPCMIQFKIKNRNVSLRTVKLGFRAIVETTNFIS